MPKYLLTLMTIALAACLGCTPPDSTPATHADADVTAGAPETTTADASLASTTRPTVGKGPVMAYVNGQPIYMSTLNNLLVESYGTRIASQLVLNELVRQEAKRLGVTITAEDVQAEEAESLDRIFGTAAQSPTQRQKLLGQLMAQYNYTPVQWEMTMRRGAMLKKIAEKQVTVSDDEIRQEFGLQYGRKVRVRHIQVATWQKAQEVLAKLKAGADFATLARQMSVSPTARVGGLLKPIGQNSTWVAPNMRKAALAMTHKGQRSNILMVGTAFHILQCEEIIDPQDKKLADVRKELTASVRQKKVLALKQQILKDLYDKARRADGIRYVNPYLKEAAAKAAQRSSP